MPDEGHDPCQYLYARPCVQEAEAVDAAYALVAFLNASEDILERQDYAPYAEQWRRYLEKRLA